MALAIHAIWCPRRLDCNCTCVCGFTQGGKRPGDRTYGSLFIRAERAAELWGDSEVAAKVQRKVLIPKGAGYWYAPAIIRRD